MICFSGLSIQRMPVGNFVTVATAIVQQFSYLTRRNNKRHRRHCQPRNQSWDNKS
jgi:hypothetical protein